MKLCASSSRMFFAIAKDTALRSPLRTRRRASHRRASPSRSDARETRQYRRFGESASFAYHSPQRGAASAGVHRYTHCRRLSAHVAPPDLVVKSTSKRQNRNPIANTMNCEGRCNDPPRVSFHCVMIRNARLRSKGLNGAAATPKVTSLVVQTRRTLHERGSFWDSWSRRTGPFAPGSGTAPHFHGARAGAAWRWNKVVAKGRVAVTRSP